MRRSDNCRGSAWLEAGIVLVLAGILIGLASMRFERAQVRSKIAEARGDLRTIATALEAYRVEYGVFPYDGYNWNGNPPERAYAFWYLPNELSTPVAYLSNTRMADPFRLHQTSLPPVDGFRFDGYRYTCVDSTWGEVYDDWETSGIGLSIFYEDVMWEFGGFRVSSGGPDGTYGPSGWYGLSTQPPYSYPATALPIPYDPTNGTLSMGDLIRSKKSPTGYLNAR